MTGARRLTAWLCAAAAVIVPRRHADWLRALHAEQETVADDREALAWGWGALRSALTWRVREDGLYVAALAFILLLGQDRLLAALVRPPHVAADTQGLSALLFDLGWGLSWALPSLLLAALKPRWALVSAVAVAFLEPDWMGFLLAIPRSLGFGWRGIEGMLFFALPTLIASLLGAGAGVLAARVLRRR